MRDADSNKKIQSHMKKGVENGNDLFTLEANFSDDDGNVDNMTM